MREPGRDKLMVVRELLSQGYEKNVALIVAIPQAIWRWGGVRMN